MQLTGLLATITDSPLVQGLLDRSAAPRAHSQAALLSAAKPALLAAAQARELGPLLLVTAREDRARQLVEELKLWSGAPDLVALFPEPDALPYEEVAPDSLTVSERLRLLTDLARRFPGAGHPLGGGVRQFVLATSIHGLLACVPAPAQLRGSLQELRVGQRFDLDQAVARWVALGYEAETLVDRPGTFARRGGVVDVFPPSSDLPVRIDLFGDEIDSLRLFDPATQRSLKLVESATVAPAQERAEGLVADASLLDYWPASGLIVLDEPRRLGECAAELETQAEELLAALREPLDSALPGPPKSGGERDGKEPAKAIWPWATVEDSLRRRPRRLELVGWEAGFLAPEEEGEDEEHSAPAGPHSPAPAPVAAGAGAGGEGLPGPGGLGLSHAADPNAPDVTVHLPFAAGQAYGGRLRNVFTDVADWRERGERVVLVSQQAPRLAELFSQAGVPLEISAGLLEPLPAGGLALVQGSLDAGWSLGSGEPGARAGGATRRVPRLVLLTDGELFGFAKVRRTPPRRPTGNALVLEGLQPGDYVVHIEHGIGRFLGTERMASSAPLSPQSWGELSPSGIGGQGGPAGEREYLVLEYAEGDRLYVPTDHLERVARYVGGSDAAPPLTRLGTQEWSRAKARVQRAVADIAEDLLDLYAGRELAAGHAYPNDTPWQQELEASFPYVETPDQVAAIRDVKVDMESGRPMDRLLVGDVGYGKTEVAIRAAFKAVMDGRQVAVLVPTTILAQQHDNTFRERMAAFPVTIEMLSRFRSAKEQREVVEALAAGRVDIVVGTHRLLQKDVRFKNLGLLIIDEEQRFGVAAKEFLKQMRREVDVLTLTATPIPRTLHMSLVGVRDLSAMETAPEERLPIKTYVGAIDDNLMRHAILRELDRGGQVFFVHNRVHNIAAVAHKLRLLVPEARIAVGHGQMPEEQLERVMLDFGQGAYDVLVSTTIIESGLDIPNANTILVHNADDFGLAQLYQLRGRVGRGSVRAYAYFLYPQSRRLTETAEQRLKAIFEASELGAGFRIAMRDLEIRGAGNLLGAEQHGHIAAVGFDLYTRLLAEAVARHRAERQAEREEEHGRDGRAGVPSGSRRRKPRVGPQTPEANLAPPTVELPLPAYLPDEYIEDLALRLDLYRRLSELTAPEQVADMDQELRDRFGELPEPARNLLAILDLRLRAGPAGVGAIFVHDGDLVVQLRQGLRVPAGFQPNLPANTYRAGSSQVRVYPDRLRGSWTNALGEVLNGLDAALGTTPARI